MKNIKAEDLLSELDFVTSRSSGPGGQHVNKVNTKVSLRFDVINSGLLSGEQKQTLLLKLASRITKEGILTISSANKRSQLRNKEATLQRLEKLLAQAFATKKKRKRTAPTKASVQKRLHEKRLQAEKKQWRQKPT